jgi:hypothetical protein
MEANVMSKKAAEHHKKASEHHTHAARHHGEAAKHYEGEHHEKAAHHAHTARGTQLTPDITAKRPRRLTLRNTARNSVSVSRAPTVKKSPH